MRTEPPLRARLLAAFAALVLAGCGRETLEIRVDASPDVQVVIAIRDARGAVVRTLTPAGSERLVRWDARDADGQRVAPGDYTATVITHRGFGTKPVGGIGFATLPGAEAGAPVGVVADAERVYLAWSGGQIAACDLEGKIAWSIALPQLAGCAALALDGGQLFALARSRPPWIAQDALVRLNAADGRIAPWPRGETLPIPTLWPPDAVEQPTHVGALGARAGRVYVTFPALHFLAVLSGVSGDYLQTIIGPAPTAIDVVPTRTESPGEPGTIIDADFAVIALGNGALGKVLFAHDPLWVIGSDTQRLDQGERISALTLLGDEAPHHPRSVFVGLAAPVSQIQRREILDPQGYVWLAGQGDGRTALGPWQPEALAAVRALALDARGRLWAAEGDAVPPRFSIWSTEGNQGRLAGEFFGPVATADRGVAVLPGQPEVVVAAGCEWRIATNGAAQCLGIITRDGMSRAAFSTSATGAVRLHVEQRDGATETYERRGAGDYAPTAVAEPPGLAALTVPGTAVALTITPDAASGWRIATTDGVPLGMAALPADIPAHAALSGAAPASDGRVFIAVVAGRIVRLEITGLNSIRSAPAQSLRVAGLPGN